MLSMYETTLHVPLIIRHPERFPAGTVRDELVSLVDISPTVLDVCGLQTDANALEARLSLCSADRVKRDFVIAENERPINGVKLLQNNYPQFDASTINHRMRMLRTRDYKLIWSSGGEVELYDIVNDPHELNNLAADAQSQAIRAKLLEQLEGWMASIQVQQPSKAFESHDAEALRRLKSLGYVD